MAPSAQSARLGLMMPIYLPITLVLVLAVSACSEGQRVEQTITTKSPSTTESPTTTESLRTTEVPSATEATTTMVAEPGLIDLQGLGSPVLAYGPDDHDPLVLADRDGQRVLWPGPIDVALPDGQGGVVLQPATESTIVWLPDIKDDAQRLVVVDGVLLLRGFLPDGRVLYSVRPHADALTESSREEFFAVTLAEGAESELVATSAAYESWTIGPVMTVGGEAAHASCHLLSSLWSGLAGASEDPESLYHGGGAEAGPTAAIEGLAATPDGRVVAFVEFDITLAEADQPEMVLLDGASFEVLARVMLSLAAGESFGYPTVSLSADGQRVLVALGAVTEQAALSVPTTPYLVEGALTGEPRVSRVDTAGALRWFDPVAASNPG
ncbi:MAG TPA: hypothetical protein VE569_09535 [Acidimicrobiia bacterium]|nr:hypothetical protein [Acidimicrobiia bacterium]